MGNSCVFTASHVVSPCTTASFVCMPNSLERWLRYTVLKEYLFSMPYIFSFDTTLFTYLSFYIQLISFLQKKRGSTASGRRRTNYEFDRISKVSERWPILTQVVTGRDAWIRKMQILSALKHFFGLGVFDTFFNLSLSCQVNLKMHWNSCI